ncbi:MAG: hypothetical protein DME07_04045 [Candidatus Rokuibacteriota bacterium]|nr:MAG: hypothetical protein DME07_04045 [Candidatus Rokubacteria bacterium]
MTKAELVAIMAKNAGGSKTSAERAMNAMGNGRDPRTGRQIQIPTVKVPRFRPSRTLKTAIR